VPEALKLQLAVGGRMVLPLGIDDQQLLVIERTAAGFKESRLSAARFVPMRMGKE
jgi:protein-L-isoaspartate(D-aspartate) O-methyltransferase